MKRIILFVLAGLLSVMSVQAQTADVQPKGKDVAETLRLIKGQWRFVYKIIENEVHYDTRVQPNADQTKMEIVIDTMAIHSYKMDQRGRTQYVVNWENATGDLIVNDWDVSGKWDIKQTPNGIDVHVLDAYYPGCPPIIRRVVNINQRQLLLQDSTTGDKYYFERR